MLECQHKMHAYLVVGSDTQNEVKKLLKSYSITTVNLMTLTTETSHGIESIREIIHYLTLQTAGKDENRGVLVEDAHLMTESAQNAFLKTLEEPPVGTIIILTAPREDLLLPTILSRCILISSNSGAPEISETAQADFEKLTDAGIGEKIQFVESVGKSREDALAFVNDQLAYLHSNLHPRGGELISGSHPWGAKLIRALMAAHADLSHNVNPKMVLFELLKHYSPLAE